MRELQVLIIAAAMALSSSASGAVIGRGLFLPGDSYVRFNFTPDSNTNYNLRFTKPITGELTISAQAYPYPDGTDPSSANNYELTINLLFTDMQFTQYLYYVDTPSDGYSVYFDPGGATLRVSGVVNSTGWIFSTSAINAVPEPLTWAFFMSGFGLIGSAMRSRRYADRRRTQIARDKGRA